MTLLRQSGGAAAVAHAAAAAGPGLSADRSIAATVAATVAGALDAGVILVDGHEVVLTNDAARSLRVVRGARLASPPLTRLVRDAGRQGFPVAADIDLPWGGVSRAVRATAAPIAATRQVVLLLTDLTESRRVDAVRRDFIANVSHELKTPVGALLLLAEAVRDSTDDPAATSRFADRMVAECYRLSRLVQDLLDLSRLQGGEPLPDLASVPVAEILADAVDRVRTAAEAAGTDLVVADAGDLQVWGDRVSLTTALTNLLDNAITYSPHGTRVAVGARLRPLEAGDEIEIAVSDRGIGIEPHEQERVFERFYRSDPARARATGGTGLGLAIVKHVAENHGGRVGLWSSVGVGSTFTLHLPVPPAPVADLTHGRRQLPGHGAENGTP